MASQKQTIAEQLEGVDWDALVKGLRRVGHAGRTMNEAGLQRRAVVILLSEMTGIGRRDVEAVLDALPKLDRRYCRGSR